MKEDVFLCEGEKLKWTFVNVEPHGATAPRFSGDMQISSFMRVGKKSSTFAMLCPAQAYPPPDYK